MGNDSIYVFFGFDMSNATIIEDSALGF